MEVKVSGILEMCWNGGEERRGPGMWELEANEYCCDEEFANDVQCDGK